MPLGTKSIEKLRCTFRCSLRRTILVAAGAEGKALGPEVTSSAIPGRRHAAFPPDLVRMMLSVSCDDDSLVLDPFGGAGTTAMVALELRHRAITIDINPEYTVEARACLGVTDIDQAAAAD
jgi:DNA modification methylase